MGIMVESSLLSIYQFYSNMKFFGNYSIPEVDEMLPFERDIFYSLLVKLKEEQNKVGM